MKSTLLSQDDLDDAIEALDFYLFSKGQDFVEVKRNRLHMLLGWLKLKRSQMMT